MSRSDKAHAFSAHGGRAETWLTHLWYKRSPAAAWPLLPFAWVFSAVVRLRRFLYARGWLKVVALDVPVVVVGNLTVGGTGKTPLVIWLVQRLADAGFRPGVVSRGYGAARTDARRVDLQSDVADAGDEPFLIARKTGVPVAVGADRVAAASLLARDRVDVIVADDGLQHYRLGRVCEIVVMDANRRFGNGWLLPAGPLRESPRRLQGVDALVLSGAGGAPGDGLRMRVRPSGVQPLGGGEIRPLAEWAGRKVHALAAIGNPRRFFDDLRAAGIEVDALPLPDHAPISAGQLKFADSLDIFMTEKDAVKCAEFAAPGRFVVLAEAQFESGDGECLLERVLAAIRKNGADKGS